jgi:hypothetical protein
MNPLLMDAVITAHQDELRRSARRASSSGRRTSRLRTLLRPTATQPSCAAPGDTVSH